MKYVNNRTNNLLMQEIILIFASNKSNHTNC